MLISSALHCDHPVINTLLQGRPTLCQGVQDKSNMAEYWRIEEGHATTKNVGCRRLLDVAFCLLNSRF
jgi:hypothetical protein